MPTDIVMPQMGESIVEGTITKWLKKPGDKIQRDEPLFEISTDKVDAEIPAPASGVLQDIKVTEGTSYTNPKWQAQRDHARRAGLVVGYLLQYVGHRAEGNDVGEWAAVKRLLGLPYVGVSPRYARRDEG